jgi:hypothetical protein
MTFCASAWLPQKSGLAIFCSISVICSSRRAPSKMPPELARPLVEIFVAPYQVFEL